MSQILDQLKQLEYEHQRTCSKKTFQKIKILRAQRDKFESDRIQKQLAFLKLKSFEDADKPGKWLSYRLRAQINSRQITKVKNGPSEISDENGIQQSF